MVAYAVVLNSPSSSKSWAQVCFLEPCLHLLLPWRFCRTSGAHKPTAARLQLVAVSLDCCNPET